MGQLERAIVDAARQCGATRVGFASAARLRDAPPSATPDSLLPSTRSAISFALPLDGETQRLFLAKKDRLPHCFERKRLAQMIYELSDRLVDLLRRRGHEALGVDVNNVYRAEPGAADVTEMTEFHPDFSHRYAAVAAGVGRLGWSGNLLTPEEGAMVELGTVLTSAELEASPLLADNPCDRCKLCAAVCPVGMIRKRQSIAVTVAGVTDEIADKRPNTCCWIGCTGYQGLDPSGRWSNWSPYRVGQALPEDKATLDALCVRLQKADPQMHLESNSFSDYRGATFDPDWFFNTVCGHCRGVCWKDREDRKENARLLRHSGVVGLTPEGVAAVPAEELEEVATPYGVNVALRRGATDPVAGPKGPPPRRARWLGPMDEALLARFFGSER